MELAEVREVTRSIHRKHLISPASTRPNAKLDGPTVALAPSGALAIKSLELQDDGFAVARQPTSREALIWLRQDLADRFALRIHQPDRTGDV
jgi:hypothetical protein